MDSLIELNRMRIVEIKATRWENDRVKTLFFSDKLCSNAKAGQFIMVWIPRVDEIPLSLSSINMNGFSSITVAEVGEATKALNRMETGDLIGIRGPFGNHFEIFGRKALVVGGGIGMAPLMPLIRELLNESVEVKVLFGVKSGKDLLFTKWLEELSSKDNMELIITTEDGSYGLKGLVTDLAERILSSERFDVIYSCGPERMLYKMFILAEEHNIPIEVSLERIMRCAIGICGSCVIGGYRVCRDGPIFRSKQLKEIKEFGRFKRGFSGEVEPI